MNPQKQNLNDARSRATRLKLLNATVDALIDVGFSRTTGVEVCRRAQLTRGALNHHFPDFADLLIATLEHVYQRLLEGTTEVEPGSMERVVVELYERVTRPEFRAVIELWMAAKNETSLRPYLGLAISEGAALFTPDRLMDHFGPVDPAAFEATYRTIFEAMIGIGLGRAVGNGEPLAHEPMVLATLKDLGRAFDLQPHQREKVK